MAVARRETMGLAKRVDAAVTVDSISVMIDYNYEMIEAALMSFSQ